MSVMVSQIISLAIVNSGADQKKTSKLHVTGPCEGPVTAEFPAQRACSAANVSFWWRHHLQAITSAARFMSPYGVTRPQWVEWFCPTQQDYKLKYLGFFAVIESLIANNIIEENDFKLVLCIYFNVISWYKTYFDLLYF